LPHAVKQAISIFPIHRKKNNRSKRIARVDYFKYREGRLLAEEVDVSVIAKTYGTPVYIYSRATVERHWHAFNDVLDQHPHLICYAVKANSNIAVLNILARLGSGFDIVSVGELERVLKAGGEPSKVVFSGVGKREDEVRRALEVRIRCFNVESELELELLNNVAREMGTYAPISLRVNPDVDPRTHPYISTGLRENKFGIECGKALNVYRRAKTLPGIKVVGIGFHIGSQLTDLMPFVDALERVLALANTLISEDIALQSVNLGGGLGIRYQRETPPAPSDFANAIFSVLKESRYEIVLEPGRAIMGNAGILITKVQYVKHTAAKNFVVVDAAMNDLMRPSLYDAWHDIRPVVAHTAAKVCRYDVVGPVCETGDFLGKDRKLQVAEGDLLAIRSAGAYGFSMSSNYNSRPRAAEILVEGTQTHLIRSRERIDDLMSGEHMIP
jgi:diaminopimelate decarboxylase